MALNTAQLIDHLDESLQGNGSADMDRRISDDPESAQEWQYIRLAADAVQDAGLYEQVESAKSVWKAQQTAPVKSSGTVVRSMYKNVMRVAACALVVAGGAGVFKYSITSSGGLYNANYTSYVLNANRGSSAQDPIEEAYKSKHWAEVVSLSNSVQDKNNKVYFLTGMADLELKKYDEAVEKFEQVIAANVQSGSDYFQDEAEFYLAMSCLARNDVNEAIPLLEKIKANKGHLFHDRAVKISSTDLRIAQYRNSK